jgi:NhaA family Na+:H+ antiporter
VAYAILPIFAFANAGLSLAGLSLTEVTHPVTMGVIAGLLFGKPIGILVFVGIAVALGLAQLPRGVSWWQLLGVAFVCGIGFTMSLFIAGLAFEHGSGAYFTGDRLGILIGSLLSALASFAILHFSLPRSAPAD